MPRSIYTSAYRKLCRLLVDARQKASLTQAELADQLDRPQSFVSKIESGERRLDIVEFLEVVEALGADVHAIIEEVESELGQAEHGN